MRDPTDAGGDTLREHSARLGFLAWIVAILVALPLCAAGLVVARPDPASLVHLLPSKSSARTSMPGDQKQQRRDTGPAVLLILGTLAPSGNYRRLRPRREPVPRPAGRPYRDEGMFPLDACPLAACLADHNGRILSLNRRARLDLERFQAGHVTDLGELMRGLPDAADVVSTWNAREPVTAKGMFSFPAGPRLLTYTVVPVAHCGEPEAALVFWEDITDQQALYKSPDHVAPPDLAGGLISAVAHNIKNPLAAIKGATELDRVRPDCASRRDLMDVIRKCSERIEKLCHSLLHFAGGHMVQMVDGWLPETLEAVAQLVEFSARSQGVTVTLEIDRETPRSRFDPVLLEQVFLNLVTNALEAMPAGGRLTLGAGCGASGGARAWVRDTGDGIPLDVAKRMFLPFFTTKAGGTGLGLALSHRIVTEVHRGRLWFTTRPGAGTVFYVELAPALEHPAGVE